MSKVVSRDQALGVIATAMINIDWDNLNGDRIQADVAQLPPQELGRRFTEFLNNGCSVSVTIVAKGVAPEIPEGKKWVEVDNVIYVKVVSNGRSGEEWITYLESKGFRLSKYAKDVLRSSDFKATSGITYTLAIIRGTAYTDRNRVSKKIRADAEKRGWLTPNAEVGCLLRDLLSDKELEELNLWWVAAMHEPIKDSDGHPRVLCADRRGGGQWLSTDWDGPDYGWDDIGAFAFLVSQVQN
jgi:hypothetical protein